MLHNNYPLNKTNVYFYIMTVQTFDITTLTKTISVNLIISDTNILPGIFLNFIKFTDLYTNDSYDDFLIKTLISNLDPNDENFELALIQNTTLTYDLGEINERQFPCKRLDYSFNPPNIKFSFFDENSDLSDVNINVSGDNLSNFTKVLTFQINNILDFTITLVYNDSMVETATASALVNPTIQPDVGSGVGSLSILEDFQNNFTLEIDNPVDGIYFSDLVNGSWSWNDETPFTLCLKNLSGDFADNYSSFEIEYSDMEFVIDLGDGNVNNSAIVPGQDIDDANNGQNIDATTTNTLTINTENNPTIVTSELLPILFKNMSSTLSLSISVTVNISATDATRDGIKSATSSRMSSVIQINVKSIFYILVILLTILAGLVILVIRYKRNRMKMMAI